jgi:hypothetical protein
LFFDSEAEMESKTYGDNIGNFQSNISAKAFFWGEY